MGRLSLLLGCMFAQKTTELIRRIRRFQSIGYSVLVVNHSCDNRYSEDSIASHDKMLEKAVMADKLKEVDKLVRSKEYHVVAIDEGQFFTDLFEQVTAWADEVPDLHIVVAGLDGTSERKPFGDLLRLIPHAEEVERLYALCAFCRDGTLASFSKYIPAVHKVDEVQVGGAEMYRPVCRTHYLS